MPTLCAMMGCMPYRRSAEGRSSWCMAGLQAGWFTPPPSSDWLVRGESEWLVFGLVEVSSPPHPGVGQEKYAQDTRGVGYLPRGDPQVGALQRARRAVMASF